MWTWPLQPPSKTLNTLNHPTSITKERNIVFMQNYITQRKKVMEAVSFESFKSVLFLTYSMNDSNINSSLICGSHLWRCWKTLQNHQSAASHVCRAATTQVEKKGVWEMKRSRWLLSYEIWKAGFTKVLLRYFSLHKTQKTHCNLITQHFLHFPQDYFHVFLLWCYITCQLGPTTC